VLIRPSDAGSEPEWREFVESQPFGHVVATGRDRIDPVVVPTQFVLAADAIVTHLARPNPIWEALAERSRALLSVAGDWAYVPSDWKVIGEEDPRAGIPTTYYAAVQLAGPVTVIDDPAEIAAVLRTQLGDVQPTVDVMDPSEHGAKLRAIRGLRIEIETVRAKFKYGGNVDVEHRLAVGERLEARAGPGDRAAARHLRRRLPGPSSED
jgi:transcriptional regulator